MTDEDLAAHLAEEAGRLLLEQLRSSLLAGTALGHVADQVANAFILTGLAEWRPGDAILSEESPDDRTRLAGSRCGRLCPGQREIVRPLAAHLRVDPFKAGLPTCPAERRPLSTGIGVRWRCMQVMRRRPRQVCCLAKGVGR